MSNHTDQEILNGISVQLKINGKKYTWHSLPRREQRRFKDRMFRLSGMLCAMAESGSIDKLDPNKVPYEFVSGVLEVFEDFNPELAKDIDKIDAYADQVNLKAIKEIVDAFGVLFEKWIAPSMNSAIEDGKKKKSTRTKKVRSTK